MICAHVLRVRSGVAPFVASLFALFFPLYVSAEPLALSFSKATEITLRPGEASTFLLPETDAASLRVVVEEKGIDVRITAHVGVRTVTTYDGDILRWGVHSLALLAPIPNGATLVVEGSRPGSPAGKVRVSVTRVASNSASQNERFGLDLLETELTQVLSGASGVPDTAISMAMHLSEGRLASGDVEAAARSAFLLERALTNGMRRNDAISSLERALPLWRQLGDRRGEASALNNIGMQHFRMGDGRLADKPLRDALAVATTAGDNLLMAVVKNNICLTRSMRTDGHAASACFEDALAMSRRTSDLARIATAHNNLGGALSQLGDTYKASEQFEIAAGLRRRIGDVVGVGDPLGNLGLERQAQGRYSEALALFEDAASAYRAANDLRGQALVTRHRGQLYTLLGDFEQASSLMTEALAFQEQLGRRDDIIHTLVRLAEVQTLSGRQDLASSSITRAINLVRIDAEPHDLAETLLRAARLYASSGNAHASYAAAVEAAQAATSVGAEDLIGRAALEMARAALETGDLKEARRDGNIAERMINRVGGPLRRADALALQARIHDRFGQPLKAELAFESAIAEIERARSFVYDPDLRATFLATQSDVFVGYISMLMRHAQEEASPEFAAKAFNVSEHYRARVLLDRLTVATASRGTMGTADSEHNRVLSHLSALALARWKLGSHPGVAERRREIEAEIVRSQETLRALMARNPSKLESVTQQNAFPADLKAIQKSLPTQTQLLDYFVTENATFVWVVARDAIQFHKLPGRDTFIQTARRVGEILGSVDQNPTLSKVDTALELACETLWKPVENDVVAERVVVVASDEIARIPFAAIRCANGRDVHYLVEQHEFTALPSASMVVLAAMHTHPARSAIKALIVADPIYARDDVRLPPPVASPNIEARRTTASEPEFVFSRLPAGNTEIGVLARILGSDDVSILDGAHASLEDLRRRGPGRFDLIHFATHGLADPRGVWGSGLVLSLYDASGKPVDGFLSMREISAWSLNAELVVLDACDAAIGWRVAGEGAMSVAYGVLTAGARHVIAPLWSIDDVAASKIAVAFYLSTHGKLDAPSRALRDAQLHLLAGEDRLRSPRYWAAFVAIGGR
jgi:CHAT domain-containing protein/tetratricopeptide (TPR) repeat protein